MKLNKFILLFFPLLVLFSCEEGFEVNLGSKKTKLIAPLNNLSTVDSIHTFYWEPMEGATKYNIQIVSPRFDSAVRLIADTVITSNKFNLELSRGEFEWRVSGKNNSTTSSYSDIWKLTIQ